MSWPSYLLSLLAFKGALVLGLAALQQEGGLLHAEAAQTAALGPIRALAYSVALSASGSRARAVLALSQERHGHPR